MEHDKTHVLFLWDLMPDPDRLRLFDIIDVSEDDSILKFDTQVSDSDESKISVLNEH